MSSSSDRTPSVAEIIQSNPAWRLSFDEKLVLGAELDRHLADCRLDMIDYDERQKAIVNATTIGDVVHLFDDLPVPPSSHVGEKTVDPHAAALRRAMTPDPTSSHLPVVRDEGATDLNPYASTARDLAAKDSSKKVMIGVLLGIAVVVILFVLLVVGGL